jgi:hypothetical protein
MFADYWKYDWVLDVLEYRPVEALLAALDRCVVRPATDAAHALIVRRAGTAGPRRS